MNYIEAREKLLQLNFSCETFFRENSYKLEEGYCNLLSGNLNDAKNCFQQIRNQDLRGDWGYLLIQFINNYIQILPSYLQIRNFLEIDINLLIKADKPDYVENIINAADLFYEVNQESYKFIARVMMNNNFPTIAKIFLDKGVLKCYKDPELHFIYGQYHLLYNNDLLAKHEFETSLEVLPGYFPAIKKLQEFNF